MSNNLEHLVQQMRCVLGTSFALYVKTHAFHWNVEGPNFAPLHELFRQQYEEIWASIDLTAEQIRALDAYAPMSMERFLTLSRILSAAPAPVSAPDMVLELMADHEVMREVLLEAIAAAQSAGEEGVLDYLSGRLDAHSKHRWMLRATAKP
jgi:starvation-inducible DNA-binding protein